LLGGYANAANTSPALSVMQKLALKQARLNGARATSQFFEHTEFSSVS